MKQVSRQSVLLGILILFHVVGLVGLSIPGYRNNMVSLSSLNLWLSFGVVILARKKHSVSFYVLILICFSLGMMVEWIGVHTGYLFGNYHYGTTLGSRFEGIPWVIGANWFVLTVCSASLVAHLKWHKTVQAILAALLMVLLDVLIEPVAIRLGYWHWSGSVVPFYNYVCWFICALPLTFLLFYRRLSEQNSVHSGLFVVLVVFFGLLNVIL